MKILGLRIEIKVTQLLDEPPVTGRRYYHKENDPEDMIDYVRVMSIEDKNVHYVKYYKSHYNSDPQRDQCSIREFNIWYKPDA